MKDDDFIKIGDEMVRVVEPIYRELDKINGELGKINGELGKINQKLDEHTDKIDALSLEMYDVHQELGGFKDQVRSEIDKIKDHTGLPSELSNP